jgi:uncharacterized protein YigE (DUF2233 family)
MFWINKHGQRYGSVRNLKNAVESEKRELSFAMNGGMYRPDHIPQGLYVENGSALTSVDTTSGNGNFYLKPNGIFYIDTLNRAFVSTTEAYQQDRATKYATQSGPMLVIDGDLHPAFKKGSTNLNIRNGVGILPDGRVIFAMSKEQVNFYDFAEFFKAQGCSNALYLDGFVSRLYLPEQNWQQLDGDFGVIIGIVK